MTDDASPVMLDDLWRNFPKTLTEFEEELCLNLGDGENQAADLSSRAISIPSRVAECDPLDDLRQLILALQSSPAFHRRHHKLEDHEGRRVLGKRAASSC